MYLGVTLLLRVLALVFLALSAFGVQSLGRSNWLGLGLFCWLLSETVVMR